jgi:hypothetical protein
MDVREISPRVFSSTTITTKDDKAGFLNEG